jgi:hypothetical protein
MVLHAGLTDDGNVAETEIGDPAIKATHGSPATSEAETDPDGIGGPLLLTELDPAFVADGTADAIDGWTGSRLTRSDKTHNDEMTVYSDIGSTDDALFGTVYDIGDGSLLIPAQVADADDGTVDNFDSNIMSPAFPNVNEVTHKANTDGSDDDSDPDYVAHMGYYQGAAGTYQCVTPIPVVDTNSCTSSRDSDGNVMLAGTGATWVFVPASGAMVTVVDSTYLHFGWWLRERMAVLDETGALAVQTFFGSSNDAYDLEPEVIGKANFEGAAAGKAAVNDALNDTVAGGHWTADVSLTADFGAAADAGTIEGEISNFSIDDSWTVALLETALLPGGDAELPIDTPFLHFNTDTGGGALEDEGTQWTIGERMGDAAGNWSGTFYMGNSPRNDSTPGGAAGEFSAQFGEDGRMIGAFGVHNVTPDATP